MRGYDKFLGDVDETTVDGDPGYRHPIFLANYSGSRAASNNKFQIADGLEVYEKTICSMSYESNLIETQTQILESSFVSILFRAAI